MPSDEVDNDANENECGHTKGLEVMNEFQSKINTAKVNLTRGHYARAAKIATKV